MIVAISRACLLAHRFGLQQKKKVRIVDNFKASGVNATCSMMEKQNCLALTSWPPHL